MELNYGPIILTAVIAVCDHYWGITLTEPDMHEPDITSVMFICSVIMILMHPSMIVPFGCRAGIFLYVGLCLVIHYLVLAYPWTCFNRLLVKLLPEAVILPFSGRMLVSTAMMIIAIRHWRRRSNDAINDAINEVYMEILGNGGFFPYMDMFPLNSVLATQSNDQFICGDMNNTNTSIRPESPPLPNIDQLREQISRCLRHSPQLD
ncbi:uncharacterized protein LOC6584563 isoform X2 [Drosophila mojavensis]|uniref:Uncharacterized protein, isoform B n=1 Tax=Drosophila mojavensis TaxID=7230 RepID=A0A0Q9WN15_DROMO|nr:uncharacterized protein LOC6584563 isoform X2 [Drosophila mojavensis]KRF94095.1 uncharacterized protein Dmoj_GI15811, isoform B [Drosophila mojavensis]